MCSKLLHNRRDSVTTILFLVIGDMTLLILTLLPEEIHLRSELSNHLLQVFHAWKLFADRSRQLSRHTISRNTDRLRDILQRIEAFPANSGTSPIIPLISLSISPALACL